MYSDDELAVPTSTDLFWSLAERNYEHARHILEDFEVQTREQALTGGKRAPMQIVGFRDVDEAYDQRDHFLEIGRALLPKVRALLDRKELTPEFVQEWGKLMFCHGLVAAYVFDDVDDLAALRGRLRSAEKRSKELQRRWLAHIFQMRDIAGLPRKAADDRVVSLLVRLKNNPQARGLYPDRWFESLLNKKNELTSSFTGKYLSQKKMAELVAKGTGGLPPLP